MFIKYLKIFIVLLILFYQSSLYSKNNNINKFNSENFSNYFSALLSYNNQNNIEALKFFKSSKSLIDKHQSYLKKYVISLILEGKVDRAIYELKYTLDKKNLDFFEAYFLLMLDSIKESDFKKSEKYLTKLSKYKEDGTFELIIYETLKKYTYLFKNKKILSNTDTFVKLSLITDTFQNCYLDENQTQSHFTYLINDNGSKSSRYIFFYVNYLIEQNELDKIKKITNQIDILNSSLLISQTKRWINRNELKKITKIFNCKNETDLLSEFFFLVATLYSTENDFRKSNFYLNISNFLNPKFKYNLALLADNYFRNKNYNQTKKILNNFNKDDDIYYWHKTKKKAQIIYEELGEEQSFNFIELKFKKIKKPEINILFDMANTAKSFKKYQVAINYYNEVLSRINANSQSYADILYRRGGSYERLSDFKKSDEDLLKSLEINANDAYVLNYLAYSWLERNYKINSAIKMLEKAYSQKKNDPFIIDSIGWGYYLVGDFVKAEKFLKRAIELMPYDPIVNDHYGDILWKLDRKIQAKYYWKNVLDFEDTEEKMKKDIRMKLLKGPKKI
tara:strand:- start:908 stop:2596 length:1689 start_codon:yes stop_codon:yes gene_type:complete